MSDKRSPDELDLSDAELIRLIRNHVADRRSVMKAVGVGTALSLGAGSVAAKHDEPHPPHIDSHYGYSAPADEKLPGKLRPDHVVELHIHEQALFDEDPTTMPFHFKPTGLKIEVGDIVRFDLESPEHTVTAYHEDQGRQQRVPDDEEPFSSPVINDGGFWLYEFDSPGTYDLVCMAHEFFGMVMRLVVGDPDDEDYDGDFGPTGQPEPRPPVSRQALNALGITKWPFPTAADVFGTDALDVSNIDSSGSVSVSDVEDDL